MLSGNGSCPFLWVCKSLLGKGSSLRTNTVNHHNGWKASSNRGMKILMDARKNLEVADTRLWDLVLTVVWRGRISYRRTIRTVTVNLTKEGMTCVRFPASSALVVIFLRRLHICLAPGSHCAFWGSLVRHLVEGVANLRSLCQQLTVTREAVE